MDVSDSTKTAEAFLKIASVYKEENNEVKNAVLDSIGESFLLWLLVCVFADKIEEDTLIRCY